MVKRFSSLNKKQTAELYKEIEAEYKNYSASEIDEEYQQLKEKYEDLKVFTEMTRDAEQQYKRLHYESALARRVENAARRTAINEMGTLKYIGSLISPQTYYSEEHKSAAENAEKAREKLSKVNLYLHSEEISERKQIYHKLKVLSAIRKKHKEARVRSLANAKLNKVRATSSTLKRKALQNHGSVSECPYCCKTVTKSEMVLDHIYPVAEGGLDTERNTVLVCYQCNASKSDLTLRVFARKFKLDYEGICERLDTLKKNF